MRLSKLKKVDLREVWKHEALHYTNWLAKPENLELLSEEIGIEISLIQTEASVGKFNVDILAEEPITGKKIVIENQLEMTDHDHLGKIITYASGFDAEIIVWIVKSVRDEHKQAIDWLNEHTDEKINIFAIEMEVWQIDNSACAPKFLIVSEPNDWAKAVKKTTSQSGLSGTQMLQLEYWTQFKEYALEHNGELRLRKPAPQNWYDVSFGTPDAFISFTINSVSGQQTCDLYIPDSDWLFDALFQRKDAIESELSENLIWDELPDKKASRIKLINHGALSDQDKWNSYHAWMLEKATAMQKVFGRHILECSN